jgi:hypothetical protein
MNQPWNILGRLAADPNVCPRFRGALGTGDGDVDATKSPSDGEAQAKPERPNNKSPKDQPA